MIELVVLLSLSCSHLLLDFLTEETGGLDEQYNDQQQKSDNITELRHGGATLDKGLRKADKEAAHQRARNGTDATENRRNEAFESGQSPPADRQRNAG